MGPYVWQTCVLSTYPRNRKGRGKGERYGRGAERGEERGGFYRGERSKEGSKGEARRGEGT